MFVACSAWISYCKRRTLGTRLRLVCAAGCSGAWNSSKRSTWAKTVNFRVTTQEFCMVGGYTEDLTNPTTVKIGRWALVQGWALARDNTVSSSMFGRSNGQPIGVHIGYCHGVHNMWIKLLFTKKCSYTTFTPHSKSSGDSPHVLAGSYVFAVYEPGQHYWDSTLLALRLSQRIRLCMLP